MGTTVFADPDWKRHPSVEEELNNSDIVFVGKVFYVKEIYDSYGLLAGTFYTLRVEDNVKGNKVKNVEIYNENNSGRFDMTIGVSYLIFAHEAFPLDGVDGRHLAIDSCGNSGTLQESGNALAKAHKLQKRQMPNESPQP